MSSGFYKVHRKMFENEYLKDHKKFYIFNQILRSASHEKTTYRGIPLLPGEFTTSYRAFAERCLATEGSTRYALKAFKERAMINITSSSHHIKITVVNWEKYQAVAQKEHNKRTKKTEEAHLSRNKNKEKRNSKETTPKKIVPDCDFFQCDELNEWVGKLPKTISDRWESYGRREKIEQFTIEAKEYADTSNKKYKSIARFVDNWLKNSHELKSILEQQKRKKVEDEWFDYLDEKHEEGKRKQREKKSALHS